MTDGSFLHHVDAWIRGAIGEERITFGELVAQLPGVDPAVVAARLKLDDARELAARVRWADVTDMSGTDARLPVPHPLDFDWRFATATTAALADELVARDLTVTLLGVPSLWLVLREHLSAGRLHLLDANPLLANLPSSDSSGHRATIVDLLNDPIPSLTPAEIVVVDPPWYPEVVTAFLWAATSLVQDGGEIWLSVPPVGTRPGVRAEREELLEQATAYGLQLRSQKAGALRYACPPFERAAMRASGLLKFVPHDWRQGDLLVFERARRSAAVRPTVRWRRWAERAIQGVRLRVDERAPSLSNDPRLLSLVEGDILRSVSRRDPLRASVRVWTSGNRVFGCDAPERLLSVIDALAAGRSIEEFEHAVAAEVQALVDHERREYICSDDGGLVVAVPSGTRRYRSE
jgi:hypothetical protein